MATKPPAQDPAQDPAPIKARVLLDCVFGPCDSVAMFATELEAQGAQAAGMVDTDPAAVAYAESLAA